MKTAVLPWFLQVISVTFAYELKCPAPGHWRLRARKFYCGQSYVCLLRSPENSYRETCDGLDISSIGSKLIFQPYFNKADCSYKRYQPFPFSTDGHNNCVYQKSFCNEEGQIVYHEGSMRNDTTCRCDPLDGYIFVSKPEHNCYCIPSKEDCACRKLTCDYKDNLCPYVGNAVLNISCEEIIARPSPEKNVSSTLKYRFIDVRMNFNKGGKYRLNCIYFVAVLLIVLTIGLPIIGLSEWPDTMYEVCSTTTPTTNRSQYKCILDHLKFSNVVDEEQCNVIKNLQSPIEQNRKLMEILLNGGEDNYYKFLEALNAFEYGDLVELIEKTQVTPTDKNRYSNLSNVERTR